MRADPETNRYTLNRWDIRPVEWWAAERRRIAEENGYANQRDYRKKGERDRDIVGVAGEYGCSRICGLAYPTDLTPSAENLARGDFPLRTGEWVDVKTMDKYYEEYFLKFRHSPSDPLPRSLLYALVTLFQWEVTLIGFIHRDNLLQEKNYLEYDYKMKDPGYCVSEKELSPTIAEALAWQSD